MENLRELFTLDFVSLFLSVVLLAIVFKFVVELFDWIVKKLGIKVDSIERFKNDHKMLEENTKKLTKEEQDIGEIIKHNEKIDNTLEKLSGSIDLIIKQLEVLETRSDNNESASMILLGDKINNRYKKYLDLNGIPEDELDEFISLHDIYHMNGGNHSGDAKFEYCMEHLPIIPSKVKLEYKKK